MGTKQVGDKVERADVTNVLNCNIPGIPDPIGPTDVLSFTGSSVRVRVGLNRNLGNIIVLWEETPSDASSEGVNLLEARSADGAAWQAGVGGTNANEHEIIHFNQGGGNARNWGFESALAASPKTGFVPLQWLPLYSNDFRQPGTGIEASVTTSPCYGTGERLGDGITSLTPELVKALPGETIVRLSYNFKNRHRADTNWSRFQADYTMYLNPNVRNLRVCYPKANGFVGPIYPYTNLTGLPESWSEMNSAGATIVCWQRH